MAGMDRDAVRAIEEWCGVTFIDGDNLEEACSF